MSFDWVAFFEQRGIEYVTSGPNVGRGEVGIKCPFCGPADHSQHMSVNLEGRGWVCRRDRRDHSGRSPARLVRQLLGCTAAEAREIAGERALPADGGVLSEVESLLGAAPLAAAPRRDLRELPEFRKFEGKPSSRPFSAYMRGRGFSEAFLRRASRDMGLRYCARGAFGGRVIFLVAQGGRLATWTGRAVSPRARLRYRALSPDPEVAMESGLPAAAAAIEQCLLWYDDLLAGGDELVIVEGPMDALKLRMLGRSATCLFTNTASESQVDFIRELAPRFRRRVVLLDRGAEAQALQATSRLAALGFRTGWLPPGVGDPGELTAATASKICY